MRLLPALLLIVVLVACEQRDRVSLATVVALTKGPTASRVIELLGEPRERPREQHAWLYTWPGENGRCFLLVGFENHVDRVRFFDLRLHSEPGGDRRILWWPGPDHFMPSEPGCTRD
jgi:hypothetical protein